MIHDYQVSFKKFICEYVHRCRGVVGSVLPYCTVLLTFDSAAKMKYLVFIRPLFPCNEIANHRALSTPNKTSLLRSSKPALHCKSHIL